MNPIAKLRNEKNLRQRDLAEIVGVSRVTVHHYESLSPADVDPENATYQALVAAAEAADVRKPDEPDHAWNDEQLIHFGQKLRDARVKAGLSQKRLADLAGTIQPYVSRMELGNTKTRLTPEEFDRLMTIIDGYDPAAEPEDENLKDGYLSAGGRRVRLDTAEAISLWDAADIDQRSAIVMAGLQALFGTDRPPLAALEDLAPEPEEAAA